MNASNAAPERKRTGLRHARPLVSLILAAYNEESLLENHLAIFSAHLKTLENEYDWEILLINDGSSDRTGEIAENYARKNPRFRVFHHKKNQGLGKALRMGFAQSAGDYVITYDVDLSYSIEHIDRLLQEIRNSGAKVVLASPSLKEGKFTRVPFVRKFLCIFANRFLSTVSSGNLTNLTSMTRVYEGNFIRSLSLRSEGMEIMPEILYKTMIMQEEIREIPGHLDWTLQTSPHSKRRSSVRIFRHTLATLFTGFLLRPILFFILPGLLVLAFSAYVNLWMFIHFFNELSAAAGGSFMDRASNALEIAYAKHPHTYLVGLLSIVLSIQLIALGVQCLQSKHYFEELFQLMSKLTNRDRDG